MSLRIKELRKINNLSQRGLAKLAGVPKTNIEQIEKHMKLPTSKELEKIAAALNVSVDELYLRK